MKYLFRAVRAPFLTATLVPVLVGTADAARKGFFDIYLFDKSILFSFKRLKIN